jgi:transcription initiation factor TFIIB
LSRCPSDKIVFDAEANIYVCTDTGEVLDERPIVEDAGKQKEDAGSPIPVNIAVHDYGIGGDVSRLKYDEARVVTLHHVLGGMVKTLGLPRHVHEEASRILRLASEKGLAYGRKKEEFVASVIYASARSYGLLVSFNEMCRRLGVDKKMTWHFYKSVVRGLGLKQPSPPIQEYVKLYAVRAGIRVEEVWSIADSLVQRLPPDIRANNPGIVAQAVLLIASLIKKGRDGCDVSGFMEERETDYCPPSLCGEARERA